MRLRKAFGFVQADGFMWTGDCPKWAAEVRRTRPDLREIRVMTMGKSGCPACFQGFH